MIIRDLREEDAGALARLTTEFTGVETTPEEMRERLRRSRGVEHPILAELQGEAAGFASLRLTPYLGEEAPYAEVSEMFVSGRFRRQGVGRALMAELERRARAAGATSLNVLTAPDNEQALALYRAMGFEVFSVALQKWFSQERPYREE
jgi:ribosomal protein S18 acetylase RimI-like enzyme